MAEVGGGMDTAGSGPVSNRVGDHIASMQTKSEEEIQANGKILEQAKNRAQATAAGAMSLVNIALLKTIIVQGPLTWYNLLTIVLVAVALVLQIIAGLVALKIQQLLSLMSKYGERSVDCSFACCPLSCMTADTQNELDASLDEEDPMIDGIFPEDNELNDPSSPIYPTDAGGRDCCGGSCVCRSNIFGVQEIKVFRMLRRLKASSVSMDMKYVKLREDAERLSQEEVARMSKELADIERSSQSGEPISGNRKDTERRRQELQKALDQVRSAQLIYRDFQVEYDTHEHQGRMLRNLAESMWKRRLTIAACMWQNILAYLMYVVAILGMLIVVFGPGTISEANGSHGTNNSDVSAKIDE